LLCFSVVILARSLFIQVYDTPNPLSLKFVPGIRVLPNGTAEFSQATGADNSPLARSLLHINGVQRVFFGEEFVTITKSYRVTSLMHITIRYVTYIHCLDEADRETVEMIKELLETRIRPTIQEDGGDSYKNGVLKLRLQGSCTGCPSSTVTLKNGIENMVQFYIPEVQMVEQVLVCLI
uniref:NFU1 iron-sulfur cluster scaffold homolog, mitochondrial n=1 Tax=Soboliphyme baturini TaxID=241478 RepID=A0A183INR2_9BILA